MNIWNKVLVGLIFVASLAFFLLGARVLKTHQYWRAAAAKLQEDLKTEQDRQVVLVEGDSATMGLRDAKVAMHKVIVDRGRVWRNCTPQKVQVGANQSVTLSLTTDQPDPHGIPVKAVLSIFEENDGGHYLGEFTVTGVGAKTLQLVPSMPLNERELQRLQKSQGPWALYEMMPADQHEVLAALDEDQIKNMFPASTVDEYLADRRAVQARATTPEAPEPSRKLRDYEVLFGQQHKLRSIWIDEMTGAKQDLGFLESALADAKQQVQYRQDEIGRLKRDRAIVAKEQAEVAAHRHAIEAKLAEVKTKARELIDSNRAMAGEIARIQLEATRRIDDETRRMAQASSGR